MWDGYEVVKRWLTKQGYVQVIVCHRETGKLVRTYEHRYIAGRVPGDGTHVHHENEIKNDNRPENLTAMTPGEHAREHPERSAAAGRIGGATVRERCASDPEFRARQATYGRLSRENWKQRCAADPDLRELARSWSSKAGKSHNSWGRVPADVIERIHTLHGQGMSPGAIARLFTSEGLPTPRGRSPRWGRTTIIKMIAGGVR